MAKDAKKQEKQAAAEEAAEITDLVHDEDAPEAEALASPKEPTKVKKAGPKSRKATLEAEAASERKERAKEEADKPAAKPQANVVNPKKRHGKNWRAANELVDQAKQYELAEGIELAKQTAKVKFDPSVELHVNLGVDPRQADQMVRSSVTLPAGTGKSLRIAVIAPADQHKAATAAGADTVGADDMIAKIEKGQLDFDTLIATPDQMPKLGKVAKILGPKGLMPNPKSGTVTTDVAKAVAEAKAGKVEFRIDKQAIIHATVGKASFKPEALMDNANALIEAIVKAKPAAAKGTYIKAMTMATSMGPGIKLNVTKVLADVNARRS